MTRNELAKAVVAKGIQTPKNPFFMSAAELQALLAKEVLVLKPRPIKGVKVHMIIKMINAGDNRKSILAKMHQAGLDTTNGYLNNVAKCHNLKIQK